MSGECDICGEWGCVETNHLRINKMKSAEDYWEKLRFEVETHNGTLYVMAKSSFIDAIAEDRQQIKSLIDEMILQAEIFKWSKYKNVVAGQIMLLTKLKNKLGEIK